MRPVFTVLSLSAGATQGWICGGGVSFRCALGRSGRRTGKREGDGATPVGAWPVRCVHYRPDRVRRPAAGVPVRAIRPGDGWCDAASDRNYNRRVRHPYPASAEEMWRTDALYDIVVELGCNDRPRARGRGSAIFIHVAHLHYTPTAGCIALARGDLLHLAARLRRGSMIRIPA